MNKSEAGKLGFIKSRETQNKQKQDRINKYNENPIRCKQCGKIFSYEERHKKFCNSSCAAIYNNSHRICKSPKTYKGQELKRKTVIENGKEIIIRDRGNCVNCGKPLGKQQHKFCSCSCQGQYKKKQLLESWKNNEHDGCIPNGQVSNFIKNYLLEKHNYKCELCGWGEVNPHTGKIPLEIHHKDGNWKNNKEENLQVLCPNCHSLTETYKASNKGKGRENRRKEV